MKKQITSVTFYKILMLLFMACSSDDDTQPVTDTNNEAPVFNAQTFIAAEDIADDTVIGTVSATDPEEDNLTFLLTQNNEDLFELTSTGELSLASGKELDFEKETSYAITVEVSDGTNKASAVISITVENVVEPFITTWETTIANEEIAFDINTDFTYDFTIDWGDGTVENNQTTGVSHTYTTAGTYTISISGTFPAFLIRFITGKMIASKLQTIEAWGDIVWESTRYMFGECVNMTYNATDAPNLSKVEDMSSMFNYCSKLNGDLSSWDVSNVTDMSEMFSNATSFNEDISTWDVSNVKDMSGMFLDATSFNGDLSSWDVSKVTNMNGMFFGEISTTLFNGDLSSWDVSKVTNMSKMFDGAASFNGDLSSWDVSNVTNMFRMFANATSFNRDLNQWDVSKVTNMDSVFNGATSFNLDLGQWDVSNTLTMSNMFLGATSFAQDLSTWDVSKVRNMGNMLTNTNISTVNYDKLLIAWAALPDLESNVTLGAGGLGYCGGTRARDILINDKGWTITGDSVAASCF